MDEFDRILGFTPNREKEAQVTGLEDTRPYRDRAELYALKDGKLYGSLFDHGGFGVYGGGIDPGEGAATAAAREYQEEAGWKVKNVRPLPFEPHTLDWKEPFTSEKQKERAKHFRGSRTHYFVGDLDEQIPDAKLDDLGRKDPRLYDFDEALRLAEQPGLSETLAAANAKRVEILKHLKENYGLKLHVKSGFENYQPVLFLVKRASSDDDRPFTIAVDLDGTLAEKEEPFDPKTIGAPRERALYWLRLFHKAGARIIIFTVRGDNALVEKWLKEHDAPYDYVNENPDQPENSSGKIFADCYWDDRAFNAEDPDEHGPTILNKINAKQKEQGEQEPVITVTLKRETTIILGSELLNAFNA